MMMNAYRPLSVREIAVLQQQGCRADDWSHIQVKDGFTPEAVEQVRFYCPVTTLRRVHTSPEWGR